jgi:hypothetical protein
MLCHRLPRAVLTSIPLFRQNRRFPRQPQAHTTATKGPHDAAAQGLEESERRQRNVVVLSGEFPGFRTVEGGLDEVGDAGSAAKPGGLSSAISGRLAGGGPRGVIGEPPGCGPVGVIGGRPGCSTVAAGHGPHSVSPINVIGGLPGARPVGIFGGLSGAGPVGVPGGGPRGVLGSTVALSSSSADPAASSTAEPPAPWPAASVPGSTVVPGCKMSGRTVAVTPGRSRFMAGRLIPRSLATANDKDRRRRRRQALSDQKRLSLVRTPPQPVKVARDESIR